MAGLFGSANTRHRLCAGPSLLASANLSCALFSGPMLQGRYTPPTSPGEPEMDSALRKVTAGFKAPDLSSCPRREVRHRGSEVGPVRRGQVLWARVYLASQRSLSHRPSWALCCMESARRSCGGEVCSSSCADSA